MDKLTAFGAEMMGTVLEGFDTATIERMIADMERAKEKPARRHREQQHDQEQQHLRPTKRPRATPRRLREGALPMSESSEKMKSENIVELCKDAPATPPRKRPRASAPAQAAPLAAAHDAAGRHPADRRHGRRLRSISRRVATSRPTTPIVGAQKVLITPGHFRQGHSRSASREGQHVNAGDALFEIDAEPFRHRA